MNMSLNNSLDSKKAGLAATVYEIDPRGDVRWREFIVAHPESSIFHTPEWLEALSRTYGYDPVVLTTARPGEPISDGVACCRINSWLTGSRIVSLPFSDHCQPLTDPGKASEALFSSMRAKVVGGNARYCEIRPRSLATTETELPLGESETCCFHWLDLRPSPEEIYKRFHYSCIQRKIRRGEREALTISEGRSEAHVKMFYDLMLLTRRRHQLPPQPLQWFRNLVACLGNAMLIRVSFKGEQPIAAVVTLAWQKTVVLKYVCSDARFHNLGAIQSLIWHVIRDAKENGASELDFGRSDSDNEGLINFKDSWGCQRSILTYYRYPTKRNPPRSQQAKSLARVFAMLPDSWLTTAGRMLYRHIG